MPTDPHPDVLYRDLAIVQVKDVFPHASPLLREIVNFGTQAFIRCLASADGEENIHLAPLALYRHVLEYTDSIEVMVANGCASAAIPNLRSSFEGLLSLEYILQADETYRTRSLSWLVTYVRKRLHSYRTLLDTSSEGRKFLASVEADRTVHDLPSPPQDEVMNAITNLESFVSRDQVREIQQEFSRFRREPNWYRLFGGPSTLRELAQRMGRPAQYEVLYREWSKTAHAGDFFPFLAPAPPGQKAIRGLRDVASTNRVTTFAATFLLDATRLLLNKFHPGETWGDWYSREVREAYMKAAQTRAGDAT